MRSSGAGPTTTFGGKRGGRARLTTCVAIVEALPRFLRLAYELQQMLPVPNGVARIICMVGHTLADCRIFLKLRKPVVWGVLKAPQSNQRFFDAIVNYLYIDSMN